MMSGHAGKHDGMRRAKLHADPHWWQCMLESVKLVAEKKPWFYTDDVVLMCRVLHPNAFTHDDRAIGPLMKLAAKLDYCVKTQHWVESSQPQNHRRPMQVWWSKLYRGPPVRQKPRRVRPLDPRQYSLWPREVQSTRETSKVPDG